MRAYRIKIYGKVQGVGFRNFIKRNAEILNVKGWVKNCPDGTVEAHFEGGEENVNKLIELCKRGPIRAEVKKLDIEETKLEGFSDFKIIY